MTLLKTYTGYRLNNSSLFVSVDDTPLKSRPDLQPGTPVDFFECGYSGIGPALLSLAILADFFSDDKSAIAWCKRCEEKIVSNLPRKKSWSLTGFDISRALNLG